MKSQPKSIVLVNIWHDDNKGDGGIAEGVLRLLKKNFPGAEIGVVSMFIENSDAFQTAHRHLKKSFPEVKIYPSPFLLHDPSRSGGFSRLLKKVLQIPLTLLQLAFSPLLNYPAIQAINSADLVISNGGQYLFTQDSYFSSLFTVYRLLYPLLIARRCRTPYILFSQSFGFHAYNRLDNLLVRSTLNNALQVWAREETSQKSLLKLGVEQSKVALVPDAAFVLEASRSEAFKSVLETYRLDSKKFWVITVRQWSSYTECFLDEIETLIRTSLESGLIEKVALVAHTQGPSEGEDDRIPTSLLFHRFHDARVVMIDDDLTPGELVALYHESKLVIGTRFHSVIFALVGGTPAYAISYAGPKTWGIMKLLDLDYLCSDMRDFSFKSVIDRVENLDLEEISMKLPEKVHKLCKQLEDNLVHLDLQD